MRAMIAVVGMLALAAPLAAQGHMGDPTKKIEGGGVFPPGWHARVDQASESTDQVKFVTMGSGYHVTLGPHTILWNATNTASGSYRVTAQFAGVLQPAGHGAGGESYGLIFGGSNLDRDNQTYFYFIIHKSGEWELRHRAGAAVHDVQTWTANPAIQAADASSKQTNTLSVEVGADKVRLLANGREVGSLDRSQLEAMSPLNGIAGMRFSHNLNGHIGSFTVEKM